MRVTRGSRVVGFVLFALLVAPVGARGDEFHSEKTGYTVAVPAGWKRIPAEAVEEFGATVMNPNKRAMLSESVAFQSAASDEWFTYPYMMVQTLPYSSLGIHRQITEAEFGQMAKALAGVDVTKAVGAALSDEARGSVSEASLGTPKLDKARHRFEVPLAMTVQDVGKMRGMLVGYFGRDALVQVGYYTKAEDWDRHAAASREMMDSFRFDPAKAYSVAAAFPGGGAYAAGQAVGACIVVGVVVVMIYFFVRSR